MILKKLNVDTSNLAAKSGFIAFKDEVDKLDIIKLLSHPISLNNLEKRVDDLDVDKLKTVYIDLRKLSDAMSKEVVENTKFNKLNMKINSLKNKILDATTYIVIIHIIHIDQYNTDKQSLEKKLEMLIKKYLMLVV